MNAPGRHEPLHVAIVAPPWFTVPPRGYGGVENVCADLVSGLMDRGHTVTLVGAGESGTAGRFVATYDEPPSARLGEPLPEVLHAAAAACSTSGSGSPRRALGGSSYVATNRP